MTKMILLVEDDPISAEVLSDYLEAHGYETSIARTGPEALQKLRDESPDLMLVDVQLPRRNGFEVCHEVRKQVNGKDLPLLLMSAVYTDQARGDMYARDGLNAQGYLVKPFELSDMLDRVQSLIGEA